MMISETIYELLYRLKFSYNWHFISDKFLSKFRPYRFKPYVVYLCETAYLKWDNIQRYVYTRIKLIELFK